MKKYFTAADKKKSVSEMLDENELVRMRKVRLGLAKADRTRDDLA